MCTLGMHMTALVWYALGNPAQVEECFRPLFHFIILVHPAYHCVHALFTPRLTQKDGWPALLLYYVAYRGFNKVTQCMIRVRGRHDPPRGIEYAPYVSWLVPCDVED
jgi:hypothetical protein